MTIRLAIVSLLLASISLYSCKTTKSVNKNSPSTANLPFTTAQFDQRVALANYLYKYYALLNYVTQSAQQNGADMNLVNRQNSLCYQDVDKNWHIVYGIFDQSLSDSGKYPHYVLDKNLRTVKDAPPLDVDRVKVLSKALSHSKNNVDSLEREHRIDLQAFAVLDSSNNNVHIWVLPTLQANNISIFGSDIQYIYNKTGEKLLYTKSHMNGFKPLQLGVLNELILDYSQYGIPTIGSLYYVASFAKNYQSITIKTTQVNSTMLWQDQINKKTMLWRHVFHY